MSTPPNAPIYQQASSIAYTSTPGISATLSRNVSQLGPAAAFSCVTRAMKNANLLRIKSINNSVPAMTNTGYVLDAQEPAAGNFSILNLSGPSNVNRTTVMNGFGINTFNTDLNGNAYPLPVVQSNTRGFDGILHVFIVSYTDPSGNVTRIPATDIVTIFNYISDAITPIQQYASQYCVCSMTLDPVIHHTTLDIDANESFNDQALSGVPGPLGGTNTGGLIDGLAYTRNWTDVAPISHAILIVGAPGVINTDANPSIGAMGYHSTSVIYNIPYIYFALQSTGLTSNDAADAYQLGISHEIAETLTDPAANPGNPDIADLCGPNCAPVWRNFFDSNNNYLFSSSTFPPSKTYSYFINAIAQPQFVGLQDCGAPSEACSYSPPVVAQTPLNFTPPNNASIPALSVKGTPDPPSASFTAMFQSGQVVKAKIINTSSGAKIIKLPIGK